VYYAILNTTYNQGDLNMLKKILLAALIVTSAVFAQVHVGGRAAFNFGTIWGEHTDNSNWGAGFNAGALAKIDVTPTIAFVPGVEVDLRRMSYDFFGVDYSMNLWYIDLPLLARFAVNPQFFVDAGLNFGVNIIAKMTEKANGVETSYDVDGMNTIDIGLVAGVGYTVIPNLDINLRLVLGLSNMTEDDGDMSSKNLRLQAGISYWFM